MRPNYYIFLYIVCLLLLGGCADSNRKIDNPISVTIEPQRYFVEKIAGKDFQVNCVTPSGQSPESYDPTPKQILQIGKSVAYFRIGYIGFEQVWMKSLEEQNPHMQVFDLSKGMAFITQDEDGHHLHGGIDPHIWTSINGAKIIAQNTYRALVSIMPENETIYRHNYEELQREIEKTEKQMHEWLAPMEGTAFIIYHPALTYFAQEFRLHQLCIEQDGKEPSPTQLKELIKTARDLQAKVVFVQLEFDQKNAKLIAKETGCRLVRINPLAYDWKEEMLNLAKYIAGKDE